MAKASNLEQIKIPSPEAHESQAPVEVIPEKNLEKVEKVENKNTLPLKKKIHLPLKSSASKVVVSPDDYETKKLQAIEDIMSSGLDKAFLAMKPNEQKRFKDEGEKTAKKISTLLGRARVSADKIVNLIRRWLSLIPRINRFFLEQEVKIKADKILNIKKNL